MPWCEDCDRYFKNEHALQQHLDNADVHRPVYLCSPCNQLFPSSHALQQHEDNSMRHVRNSYTYVCPYGCLWGTNRSSKLDDHRKTIHHWCKEHDRCFQNENNLNQHLLSKAHVTGKKCPFCGVDTFPTLYALTLHMESGRCEGGMNRLKVDRRIHELDTSGVVTNQRLIGYNNTWEPERDIWATQNAWNGQAFECYFCYNAYSSLGRLNSHITQAHAEKRTNTLYHCPGEGCGKNFRYFSQLMGHVEQSHTCRVRHSAPMLKQHFGRRLLGN